MRAILFLLLSIILFNCSSQKLKRGPKIIDGRKVKEHIVQENLIVTVPRNWRRIFNHGSIGFSPLGSMGYYKNGIKIFYSNKNDTSYPSFDEYVKNIIQRMQEGRNIKMENQSVLLDTTQYGKTYTYKFSVKTGIAEEVTINKFFEQNENYYHFYNRSYRQYFKKYSSDSEFIFNNLKFKD